MSNQSFTVRVDQKINSQRTNKLSSAEITADNIAVKSLTASSLNSNCLNGYNLVQTTLYTPNSFKASTGFEGWLYTIPSYTPSVLGPSDPYFFVFPIDSMILGITASNASPSDLFNATDITVGYGVYSLTPSTSDLLAAVSAANLNSLGGVAAGTSLAEIPNGALALGTTGSTVNSGYVASTSNNGMLLEVTGTTGSTDSLVFKISYLVPM
jgi:hypothetical protein